MASEEDEEIDDVDEEIARIERQLQELEREAGEVPEPEAPEPGEDDVDAPRPEEAFEGEPDVEEEEGVLDRLRDRLRELRESKEPAEDETAAEDEAAEPEDEEAESSSVLPFLDPDTDDEEDEPEDEPDEEDAHASDDDDPPSQETEPAEPETDEQPSASPSEEWPSAETDEQATADEDPDDDEDPEEDPEEAADETSLLGGLTTSFGGEEEPSETEAATGLEAHPGTDPALARHGEPPTPSARGARIPGVGDEEPEASRASALLARFQGGGSGDPQGAPADEEDDDDGGIVVPVIVALLLLAGLAAGAYALLGGADGEAPTAKLVADSFTNDEGSYIASTGQPLVLDAGGSQGSIDEYAWDFDDGAQETTSEPTVEHAYEEAGTYTVEVTARGPGGEDTVQIEVVVVEAPSAQPEILANGEAVADAGTVGNNVFLGDPVTLDASASTADPDHTISSYTWDTNGDGEPDATGRTAELSFDEAGRWTVELTVTDDLGNEDTASRALHVSDRRVVQETIGPSTTEAAQQNHSVPIDAARQGVGPIQLDVQLTYNASSNDTGDLPAQPEVDTDLDLNVTDPQGNVYEAEDDGGQGEETLTVERADLVNFGEWTVNVRQDELNSGSATEVEYELTIETLY